MSGLEESTRPRKKLSHELDRLEGKLKELQILYEQYFVDVLPKPPTSQHDEIKRTIRMLLKAPFKNSQVRFRLRMLVQRFQTYATYWERVNKQREEGTYTKDLFKAELRDRLLEDAKRDASQAGKAEKRIRELYSTYETAVKKVGGDTGKLNFDSFKKALIKKAKQLKNEQGVKKLQYKVVVNEGKVTIKASGKKE